MKIMDRTRKISGLILLSVFLSSCATQSDNISKPTDRHIYGVDCSGAASSMSACNDQARNLCPRGYTIISKLDPSNSAVDMTMSDNSPTNISNKRGMTILCK